MSIVTRATKGSALTTAELDNNFTELENAITDGGVVNVLDYGADKTGAADSLAAFQRALAALQDGQTFLIPAGLYSLSNKFTFTKYRCVFDCRARLIPYGSYSGFLIEFRQTIGDSTQLNVAQRVQVRRLYIDGLYQSRGVRFEGVYCTDIHGIIVTRAHGTALEIGSNCYENSWHHISLNLCKNRQAFTTPSDWSNSTSYVVGDRVRFKHTDYASGTTYAAGELVDSSGISYMSIKGGNTGHTPASSPTWWARIDDSFFECMIAHSAKSPFSGSVFTTNNGTAGNRYWKHALQCEPLFNIEHTSSVGVTDHQYIYGLDIRDNDSKYLMHIDNNGNSREVYAIEVHGGMIHAMTPGVPAGSSGNLIDPTFTRHVLMGRTIDCKFIGVNVRIAQVDDSIGICYGLTPPAKCSYAMHFSGRIDGEASRQIGILSGAGQSILTTQKHFISHLFPVLTGADSAASVDPWNDYGYDLVAPVRGANVGRRNSRLKLNANQSIADNTNTQLSLVADYDADGVYVAGNPTRITPPETWLAWKLAASVHWNPASSGVRGLQFIRNGSATFTGNSGSVIASAGATYGTKQRIETDVIYRSAVGEYFEVDLFQNSGGALDALANSFTWVSIERVM